MRWAVREIKNQNSKIKILVLMLRASVVDDCVADITGSRMRNWPLATGH